MSETNTVLVLHISAADALTHDTRLAFDPSAIEGMPAHVTLLYPFKPVAELTDDDIDKLGEICAQHACIDLTFAHLSRFSGVLWLAPEPSLPVRHLAATLASAFPEWPPYGGAHIEVVPHLTLAHLGGDDAEMRLDQIGEIFMETAERHLPLRQIISQVSLFDMTTTGRWHEVRSFPLGR
ncbi:MAG: 2'-5' RNA ligase family protein [Parvibaculaceae bacterium]